MWGGLPHGSIPKLNVKQESLVGGVREAWCIGGTHVFQRGWRTGCEVGSCEAGAGSHENAKELGSSYSQLAGLKQKEVCLQKCSSSPTSSPYPTPSSHMLSIPYANLTSGSSQIKKRSYKLAYTLE